MEENIDDSWIKKAKEKIEIEVQISIKSLEELADKLDLEKD